MFLKKKAHNLFSKSIALALKGDKGSVRVIEAHQDNVRITDNTSKQKKNIKPSKKIINEGLVDTQE